MISSCVQFIPNTYTPPKQTDGFQKMMTFRKGISSFRATTHPIFGHVFYHRPVCQSWIASRQLHQPSLQTLAADPHVWVTAGIAKKHPTYQDVPGMTLVLIVKDQPPKQRTNGFQVYIYINTDVHVYHAYGDPIEICRMLAFMPDETVLKLRLTSEVEHSVDKLSDEVVTYV